MSSNINFKGNPELRDWLLYYGKNYAFFAPNDFLPTDIINMFRTKPQQNAVGCIITNLYLAWLSRYCVRISRDKNKWNSGAVSVPYGYGFGCQMGVLDDLIGLGFIHQVLGNMFIEDGMQTRIWASPELEGLFININRSQLLLHLKEIFTGPFKRMPTPLELKDNAKNCLEFPVRGRVSILWNEVMELNQAFKSFSEQKRIDFREDIPISRISISNPYTEQPVIQQTKKTTNLTPNPLTSTIPTPSSISTSITYSPIYSIPIPVSCIIPELLRLPQYVRRVFNNGSWDQGGRFYGPIYQGWNKEQRSYITIDGEECAEFDFSALHPALCFSLNGLQLQHDPYDAQGLSCDRIVRKVVLLCAVNAKSRQGAIQGAINDLSRDAMKQPKGWLENLLCGDTFGEIYDALSEHNRPIINYFGSGIGVKLQLLDSNITSNILLSFIKRNEVCLAVHDSYLVKKSLKQELCQVMEQTYKEHNNGFYCKIT